MKNSGSLVLVVVELAVIPVEYWVLEVETVGILVREVDLVSELEMMVAVLDTTVTIGWVGRDLLFLIGTLVPSGPSGPYPLDSWSSNSILFHALS